MEKVVGHSRPWLLLALAAVLLAGPPVPDGYAKRTKSFLRTVVDGKRLKASKRGIQGYLAGASFTVSGVAKRKRGIFRTVTVTCGPVDLTAVPPAITLTGCFGTYTEQGSKTGSFRQWSGTGVELTVDSFDGDRLIGTFRGVLVDASTANPSDASATVGVEGGSFSISLVNLGV
jgi:hypothetical protein